VTLTQYAAGLYSAAQNGMGLASAFHAPGSAVNEANPASPGETISIFATGLGATNPPVGTGVPAPATSPAVTVVQPTVTIGGVSATVVSSALEANQIGVYQINVTVPSSGLTNGDQALVLSIGASTSNTLAIESDAGARQIGRQATATYGHCKGSHAIFYAMAKGSVPKSEKSEVLQGTLDLMILKTLQALGPLHGFGIARRIEQLSEDLLQLNEGTVYTSLLRLQQQGWISAGWGTSENNRKAKFYSITKSGLKQLVRETESWERISGVIGRVLRLEGQR